MKWFSARTLAGAVLLSGAVACADGPITAPHAVSAAGETANAVVANSGKWGTLAPRPITGPYACAVARGNSVWTFAGYTEFETYSGFHPFTARLDLETNTWFEGPALPPGFNPQYCRAESVGGKIFVASNLGTGALVRFNPGLGTYTPMATGPDVYRGATAATSTHLYRLGGGSDDVWRYDPATNTWAQLADMPENVLGHSALAIGTKIYVLGGDGMDGVIWFYDIPTDTWDGAGDAPVMHEPSLAELDGVLYAFARNGAWAYVPNANQWTPLNAWPASVAGSAIAKVGRQFVLVGGYTEVGETTYEVELNDVTRTFRPYSVGNHAPVAGFTVPTTRIEGNFVQFTSTSSDPDGDPLDYSWDFGDGNTSDSQDPTNTYEIGGNYTVSLTVSDGTLSKTIVRTVIVQSLTPAAPTVVGVEWDSDEEEITIAYQWNGDVGATHMQIQRSFVDGAAYVPYVSVAYPSDTTHLFRDSEYADGQKYRYRIRACRVSNCSSWVYSRAVVTMAVPTTPTGLSVSTTPPLPIVFFSWDMPTDASFHRVLRRSRLDNLAPWSAWEERATGNGAADLFGDTEVTAGMQYQYRLELCNLAGCAPVRQSSVVTASF